MKLNPELEDIYLNFLKYPFISCNDLGNMFKLLIQNKNVTDTKQRDIRQNIIMLRDRLDYIIKNDFDV